MKAISVYDIHATTSPGRAQFETALAERNSRNIEGPALFLSRQRVRKNLRELSAALPGVTIHYAVKSNDHAALLRTVSEEGHRFDISSAAEIDSVMEAGAQTKDLLHTHPIKSESEITGALRRGVNTFVIDNSDEIAKFISYRDQVRLVVRFRAISAEESAAVVQCNLSYKFGCEPDEIIDLTQEILDAGIGYAGLAFHVGSQCLSVNPYLQGVNIASDIITELASRGIETYLLDIGGGFPVEYAEKVTPIEEFCRPLRLALDSLIPKSVNLVCEPGRFISATAVTLLVNVIGKSRRSGVAWYYIDDGVYGSFSGRIYDQCSYQTLTNRNSTWLPSTLAGPTCDSIDIIYENIFLPPLEIGDTLVFPALGAYSSVSASKFNSLTQAKTIVID